MKEVSQVYPNKGIEEQYRKKLNKLVDAMVLSAVYWILANYKGRSAKELSFIIRKKVKQWKKTFGKDSEKIAEWFVRSVKNGTEFGMKSAFTKAGVNIRSSVPKEIALGVEYENKALIDSIPEKYFSGVEVVCMLALLYNWDKERLEQELDKRNGIVKRRVVLIAKDQTGKTTELFKREICKRAGVKFARWVYTWKSEKPRKDHIEMNGALYELEKGCFNYYTNEYEFPKEKIGCKCDFKPVIEELGDNIKEQIKRRIDKR